MWFRMNDIKENAYELVNQIYYKGIKPLIVEKENYAYAEDPIFKIKRNRIVAEITKAIIRLKLESKENIIEKFCNYLRKNQNKDGSWNEIHPNYNQPSALITSIVGEALLMNYRQFPSDDLEKSIHQASRFVLSQEKSPGYFLKSMQKTADHLNVDATCGAFLTLYGKEFSDEKILEVGRKTAEHIREYQFSDGSFPYTINKGNYTYLFDVPCVHYQGVTLFYLSKINEIIKEEWLENCLKSGAMWLSDAQRDDGRFDWSKSGLMFSYYLSGAYAFAFSSFLYASKWDKKYFDNANLCLSVLKKNIHDLVLRWESESWTTFPQSIHETLKTALLGNYPYKQRVFRLGYGSYRQIARRRFSNQIDDRFFKNFTNLLKIESSTIESFRNYPDLFMTSEVLDCISSYKLLLRGDLDII
jgi:hypothetical protein